jgi:UDP-glucose 6-dehydrogenase
LSRVAVIGAGYVGLTTAACLADLGNDVIVVDTNREKVAQLLRNHVPFYEPGLSELVERNTKAKRLTFTTSYEEAVPGAEYAIIAVSTPEGEGGEADLSFVESAAGSIADWMDGPLVVVNKSTVPPLTGDMVSRVIGQRKDRLPGCRREGGQQAGPRRVAGRDDPRRGRVAAPPRSGGVIVSGPLVEGDASRRRPGRPRPARRNR